MRSPLDLQKGKVGAAAGARIREPLYQQKGVPKHSFLLNSDYNLDTPTKAVQKAVHTVTLNFLSLLTCRRAKAPFLFQTKSFRHATSLWDAPMLFVIL